MRIEIKCDAAIARIVRGELELLRPERARPNPSSKAAAPNAKSRASAHHQRQFVQTRSLIERWWPVLPKGGDGRETPRQVQLSPTTGIGMQGKVGRTGNTVYKISF
jgi:hypothetical protein